ncbi:hypothetical protein QQ045_019601 [Rhodiola kirilowii]
MGRAPCCEKSNGLKKGPWTPEEDQKLTQYIQIHGPGNWRTLPRNAGLDRCGKSCRLRWTNYLRPDIKRGRFSFEEEEAIIQLHSVLGNKWSAIAARLPGRTDNEIKNYWNTHIRKRLLRNGIDPVTHTPRIDLFHELTTLLRLNNNPPLCNQNALINLSNLLTLNQQISNPQFLNLATSLLTLNQQQKSPADLLPETKFEMQNPSSVNHAQFQQFQLCPSGVNHAQQLMHGGGDNNLGSIDIGSKVESFKSSPMSSHETQSPSNQFGTGLMYDYGGQPNLSSYSSFQSLNESNQQKQHSLDSILSIPNNGSTEEDKDTYCSSLFNFEIPEGLDMSYLL